jgi:hypothetical protein
MAITAVEVMSYVAILKSSLNKRKSLRGNDQDDGMIQTYISTRPVGGSPSTLDWRDKKN